MNFIVTIQQRVRVRAESEQKAKEIAETHPPFRWSFETDYSLKTMPIIEVVDIREEER